MPKFFPLSVLLNTLREKIKLFLVNIGLGDSKYFWVHESFGESDESHKHSLQKGVHVHQAHIQVQDFTGSVKLRRGPRSWRSELLT